MFESQKQSESLSCFDIVVDHGWTAWLIQYDLSQEHVYGMIIDLYNLKSDVIF